MTDKEKAKAYDEALEKAKEILEMTSDKSAIYTIFPELAESEDEKVEKAIFGMVYDSDNELWSSYDVSKSDVLDWLEKQGKKEPISFASGEDGKIMNLIFSIIQNTSAHSEYFASDIKKEDCIEWLNSLRLRLTDGEE